MPTTENELPGQADRYTVRSQVPTIGLEEIIKACKTLGLSWFIVPDEFNLMYCAVYIFFDKQGLKNYMNGLYAAKED